MRASVNLFALGVATIIIVVVARPVRTEDTYSCNGYHEADKLKPPLRGYRIF